MRAVVAERPGPPEVLHVVDGPDPVPDPGEVVVEVAVAAITFVDTQLRAGTSQGPTTSFPIVLGNGVGGAVVAVGDRVDPSWLGTQVVTSTGGHGGYATHARARESDLHRVPDGLGLEAATALLADGRTAVGLARAAQITPRDTVAVTAAAGGVGSLLVQLARSAGARVVALAGDDRKLTHATHLGADIAVNYRDPRWTEQLDAVAPEGLDVAFDGVGGETTEVLFGRVRPGGRYLPHGAASGTWGAVDQDSAAARGVTIIPLTAIGPGTESYALAEQALALAARGALHPTIGQTHPLDRAEDAHRAIEARSTIGKTLLLP